MTLPFGTRKGGAAIASIFALFTSLSGAACSVVGVRTVEEPSYHVIEQAGLVQIRQYDARVAAQTTVQADAEGARSAGFRRLAAYIFGGNQAQASIAMTAPVAQNGEQIAMTAPVVQQGQTGAQTIQFFMPKTYTLSTLPKPNDPAVKLVDVPGETVAVLRYSGSISPPSVAAKQAELLAGLKATKWRPIGDPAAWFYDPPWTLPPFRRNEVAVPVSGS